jgi:hypothetical protein
MYSCITDSDVSCASRPSCPSFIHCSRGPHRRSQPLDSLRSLAAAAGAPFLPHPRPYGGTAQTASVLGKIPPTIVTAAAMASAA